jgi:hypothetical protein
MTPKKSFNLLGDATFKNATYDDCLIRGGTNKKEVWFFLFQR